MSVIHSCPTSGNARRGTVILLVIGLVAGLALLATIFLIEILGMRASNREYLRQSLSRLAAEAGREHAIAVLNQQYLDEVATKNATTRSSPYRSAFLPPSDYSGEVPGYAGPLNNTYHIWADVAGWGSQGSGTDGHGAVTSLHGVGVQTEGLWSPNYHSRFLTFEHYDAELLPVADPVATPELVAFRARYDVAISLVDPMFSLRPDFGTDEYKLPGDATTFVSQPSTMFNTENSVLSSTDPELDTRRDMKWQYMHLYGRSLTSIIATGPKRTFDGQPAARIWSEVVIEENADGNQTVRPAPGATWWVYSTGGGDPGSDLAHLKFEDQDRYNPGDTAAWDYWRRGKFGYTSDEPRHVADLWHGLGIGRSANEEKIYNHHLDLLTWHTHSSRRGDEDGPLKLKYDAPAVVGIGGEEMHTPKQAIANINLSHAQYHMPTSFEQYVTVGSGIVDYDSAVDSATMDVGGVPWEINALVVPQPVLYRMVAGLSMQMGHASEDKGNNDWDGGSVSRDWVDHDGDGDKENRITELKTVSRKINFYNGPKGDVDAQGYHLGNSTDAGSHAFELLWDVPMPDGSEHSFAGGIATRFSGEPYLEEIGYAGLNPFYDDSKASQDQENSEQLYNYLDGVWDSSGAGTADKPYDRFMNRLAYIRWVSWKHEFSSSSPVIEQRLMEIDAAVSYEEGLRYYRRPDGRSLRRDIGTTSERQHFDGDAERMGIDLQATWDSVTNPHTGSSDSTGAKVTKAHGSGNTISDLTGTYPAVSLADGANLRYRVFPHTYPGPMWTGREGRWDRDGTGWLSQSVTGEADSETYGNGTSESLWSHNQEPVAHGSDSGNDIYTYAFGERIRPMSGDGTQSERGEDAFAWDIAIAIYLAVGEAIETAEGEYGSGPVSPTIASMDERAMQVLFGGTLENYAFANNLVVSHLYNPVEPVDTNGDGQYDPSVDTVNVDFDGDGTDDLTNVPAVRDPEYIYGEYNQFWPVADPAIPHPDLDPAGAASFPMAIDAAKDMMNGVDASPTFSSWKLGAHYDEIQTFASDDFYYHHPRALMMASMMVNDFRQSLFGAGTPVTMATFQTTASANTVVGTSLGDMDVSGVAGTHVFVAGRNQDMRTTGTPTPKPFSRTGRLVIKPDRFWRIQVRSHLVNESLPAKDYEQDLVETFLDILYCTDLDEDGAVDDGSVLYQRVKNTTRRHRR